LCCWRGATLIFSAGKAKQLVWVEGDFWQGPKDECTLNLAHVILEHGLRFECASQLEAISDLERLAQRLRNGFVSSSIVFEPSAHVSAEQLASTIPEPLAAFGCNWGVWWYLPLPKCKYTWRKARFSWWRLSQSPGPLWCKTFAPSIGSDWLRAVICILRGDSYQHGVITKFCDLSASLFILKLLLKRKKKAIIF